MDWETGGGSPWEVFLAGFGMGMLLLGGLPAGFVYR
jgi:hypothetical protein